MDLLARKLTGSFLGKESPSRECKENNCDTTGQVDINALLQKLTAFSSTAWRASSCDASHIYKKGSKQRTSVPCDDVVGTAQLWLKTILHWNHSVSAKKNKDFLCSQMYPLTSWWCISIMFSGSLAEVWNLSMPSFIDVLDCILLVLCPPDVG